MNFLSFSFQKRNNDILAIFLKKIGIKFRTIIQTFHLTLSCIGHNLLNRNSKIKAKTIDKLNHIQKAHFLNLTDKPNSISQSDLQQIIIKIDLKTLSILIDNILVLVFFNVPLNVFRTHQLG